MTKVYGIFTAMEKKPQKSNDLVIYPSLVVFGLIYDAIIGYLERKHLLEGFTAYAVAFGVTVTLGGVAVKDKKAALQCFLGFVASGTPMILGATWRYAEARRREQEYVRQAEGLAHRSKAR